MRTGAVVASATLGDAPWPGTEALYWTALDVPAPRDREVADYTVRLEPASLDAVPTRFSVAVAAKPDLHADRHGDRAGHPGGAGRRGDPARPVSRPHRQGRPRRAARLHAASISFSSGARRTSPQPQPIRVDRDDSLELTMVHVPEEHPDARWVR